MASFSNRKRQRTKNHMDVRARMILVIALAITFLGALRWAINVTNANARQLSANLSQIQNQYNTGTTASSGDSTSHSSFRTFSAGKSVPGPSVEPEGNGARP